MSNPQEITVSTRGRPKKDAAPLKKGRSSWKPASVTEVINKEDGYRYRWANKNPDNLAKKEAEGWETVSKITSDKSLNVPSGKINDGANLSSIQEKHDVILQRLPEELALERDDYYQSETNRRTAGLTAHVKKEIGKEGAASHGEITISSRTGTQVID